MTDTIWEKFIRKPDISEPRPVLKIPIKSIRPNPFQPRRNFTPGELQELADSIRAHGVIQPIIVTESAENSAEYILVVGERRLRAAALAGLSEIPAIFGSYSESELAEVALVENLQRKDLNPLEEATAYRELLERFGLTQDELGSRLGKSQSAIANKLRLLTLPPAVMEYISREIITERHARALLRLSPDQATFAVEQVVKGELTVKQTEALVTRMLEEQQVRRKKIIRIFKDARLFKNSVLKLVKELEASGLVVKVSEVNQEDEYQLTVNISKGNRRQS